MTKEQKKQLEKKRQAWLDAVKHSRILSDMIYSLQVGLTKNHERVVQTYGEYHDLYMEINFPNKNTK